MSDNMRWDLLLATLLIALPFQENGVLAFLSSRGHHLTPSLYSIQIQPLKSAADDIEPYVGPVGSMGDMEGGIVVGK
jgi:hypothetical protein